MKLFCTHHFLVTPPHVFSLDAGLIDGRKIPRITPQSLPTPRENSDPDSEGLPIRINTEGFWQTPKFCGTEVLARPIFAGGWAAYFIGQGVIETGTGKGTFYWFGISVDYEIFLPMI